MLGEKIKQLRVSHGLNQTEFAKMLFVTPGAVSQWETNRTVPDTERLISIANAFQVSLDYFSDKQYSENEQADPQNHKMPDEDQDSMEILERLRRDPETRMLFNLARRSSPESIRAAAAVLKALEPEEEE